MKKKLLILVCIMMMLFGSVLTVSAAETSDSSEPETYHYYYNENAKRYNMYEKYFVYEMSSELDSDRLIAGIYFEDRNSISLIILNDAGVAYSVDELHRPVVKTYEVLEDTGINGADSYYSIGQRVYAININREWNEYTTHSGISYMRMSTNIPYFSTEDEAVNYLKTGDLTGNLNDLTDTDKMEEDSSFAFTGFTADSTGKTGYIKANWTGTTHDDKIDTYKEAKYTVHAGYAFTAQPGQIATIDSNCFDGDIADKGFLQTYNSLKASDDTLFLRYLKVVPYYTIGDGLFGQSYKGKPCTIWLNEDGSIENIDIEDNNGGGGSSLYEYDYDFKLCNFKFGWSSFLFDKTAKLIHWSGSTKDNLIKFNGYKNSFVDVSVLGVDSSGATKEFDFFDIDKYLEEINVHQNSLTTSNSFNVSGKKFNEYMIDYDCQFEGFLKLTPCYKVKDKVYIGTTSLVNIYTGEVSEITKDEDNDDIITPVVPPSDNPDKPVEDIPGIGDIDDITDIVPFFINLIKAFIGGIGEIPQFLNYVFPFLPVEICYMLSLGMIICVVLRVIGR